MIESLGNKPPKWLWKWTVGALALWWVSNLLAKFVTDLRNLFIIMLVSLLLASGIEPLVNKLEKKGWRRGVSTFSIIFTSVGVLVASVLGAGAVVASQTKEMINSLPKLIELISKYAKEIGITLDPVAVNKSINTTLENFWRNSFDDAILQTGEFIGQGLIGAFILFYLVADGPRLRRNICAILPARRQEIVLDIWTHAIDKAGGYLNMRVALAAMASATTWLAFTLIQTPYALALAVWVGVMSQLIPVIGTYLAAALPILMTLVSDSPNKALWVVIFIVIYQQIENMVIAPKLGREMMSVHPAVGFVAVIAGGSIAGAAGALMAAPLVATVQAALSASVEKYQLIESELLNETERKKKERKKRNNFKKIDDQDDKNLSN